MGDRRAGPGDRPASPPCPGPASWWWPRSVPRWPPPGPTSSALARQPGKLVRLFGGAVGAQLLFAITLGCALHAYGQSLSLAALLVINTLASLIGGIAPVPGGMGVIEAGLIAGFTAAGVPATEAVAATFTARLFTCYLPPIWGYPTLAYMRHREYL